MKLRAYIKNIKSMPDEKADLIASYFKMEIFAKGMLLIQDRKTSKKSYFLESGIIK